MDLGENTLFLYADILGFKNLLKNHKTKIQKIFDIINNSTVFRDDNNKLGLKAFMFSDTFVIYYSKCEEEISVVIDMITGLVRHLKHQLSKIDVFIRAQLKIGDFVYKKLENIDVFYGDILVSANDEDKEIQSIGLFFDNKINENNKNFCNIKYNEKKYFIFDCHELRSFYNASKANRLKNNGNIFPTDYMNSLKPYKNEIIDEINYLKKIYNLSIGYCKYCIDDQIFFQKLEPHITNKYISVWNFYYNKYPELLDYLVKSNFDLKTLCSDREWLEFLNI